MPRVKEASVSNGKKSSQAATQARPRPTPNTSSQDTTDATQGCQLEEINTSFQDATDATQACLSEEETSEEETNAFSFHSLLE